jgi:hypothetical protein
MGSIIRRSRLNGEDVETIGFPWENYDLAYMYSCYCSRFARGKFRFWVESEKSQPAKPKEERKRPVLADEQTYLFMDV